MAKQLDYLEITVKCIMKQAGTNKAFGSRQ